jgi:hypothetical protein
MTAAWSWEIGADEPSEYSTRASIGGILAIIGGALLAVGSFLPWAEVSWGGTSVTAQGIDDSYGYFTLAAGSFALIVGIVMRRGAKRELAVLAVLAGLVGGGVGLYEALTIRDSVLDAAAEQLAPSFALDQAIETGQLGLSISIGLYAVIAGGVVALVGGIVGLGGSPSEPAAAETSSVAPAAPAVTDVGNAPSASSAPPTATSPPADQAGA